MVKLPGTCSDCGAAFKGDIKAHVADAHPGLPRGRFRDPKGVDHVTCLKCDEDFAGDRLVGQTQYVPGKSTDPVRIADLHIQTHEGEA